MTCVHTALEDLPTLLLESGLNVVVANGYLQGQCEGNDHYRWTDPDTGEAGHDKPPHGYQVHHSASSSATPPPANTSKGGAWIGLWRDGRLYQYGDGEPTIYLATAGPARVSSGYGYRPAAWDYTFKDKRAPWKAEGADGSTALNRYVFSVETVCEGRGTPLDQGVWDHVVGLGVVLQRMFGWTERALGHNSWSTRKPDPEWTVGQPNDGQRAIIDVQNRIAQGVDMSCPWNPNAPSGSPWHTSYPKCDKHYEGNAPIEWGVNTGVCNINSWAEASVQKLIDNGRINVKDSSRDDGAVLLTTERYWVFEARATT